MSAPQQLLNSPLPQAYKTIWLAHCGLNGLQALLGVLVLLGLRRVGLWLGCASWVLEPVLMHATNVASPAPSQLLATPYLTAFAVLAGVAALAAWHAGEAQWPQEHRPGLLRWSALALEVGFAGVVVAFASFGWIGYGAPPREAVPPLERVDASWPEPAAFLEPELENLDGGREPVLADDGRAGTIVHYWSDWGDGRRAVHEMNTAHLRLEPDDVRVVHVSVRIRSAAELRDRLHSWSSPRGRYGRHIIAEPDGTWAELHGQLAEGGVELSMFDLPLALVLDREGRVVDAWTGLQRPETVRVRALAALRRTGSR